MKRRAVLAVAGSSVCVGVSGCLEELSSSAATVGEEELPNRPAELDEESAMRYVEAYESAYQHNESLRPSLTGLETTCPPVLDHDGNDGVYVSTRCFVSVSTADSDGSDLSDPALYLVSPDDAIRVEPERQLHRDPSLTVDQTRNDGRGVWLSNFADRSHELAVELVHGSDDEPITVLDDTYALDPADGTVVSSVTGIPGEYTVRCALADGTEATGNVDVRSTAPDATYTGGESILAAAHVTPAGALELRTINFEEPSF